MAQSQEELLGKLGLMGLQPGQVIPTSVRLLLQIHHDLDCLLQLQLRLALGWRVEEIIEDMGLNVPRRH